MAEGYGRWLAAVGILSFDWTSVPRRSLAGTEVVAVPESRPASLGNYCSITIES